MSSFELPGYEILDQIGQGGMARVFKARQLALDRIVAIKVMSHGSVNTPDALNRFKTEVHALAKLNHACIVHI